MEILQLGPYPPPHGGVQTNLVAIRDYVRRQGDRCRVINLTRYRQREHDDVYFPQSAGELLSLLLRLKYDIVHLHIGGNVTTRLLLLGLACSARPGTKAVLSFHSGGYPTSEAGKTAGRWTLRGFVFRRFDRIIAVNRQLAEMFVQTFGVHRDRVRLIYPHVLPASIPDTEFPPQVARFFETHEQVLLSMGWLEPEYDFALQIRALEHVRNHFPGAGLMILGAGRLEPDLRAQLSTLSYAGHVLLAGDVPHDVALMSMARCHLFLRTTWYDGDAISVREALHFGTPVVATDNGMRPPGLTIIPVSDLSALENAIVNQLSKGKPDTRPVQADYANISAVYELYREMMRG